MAKGFGAGGRYPLLGWTSGDIRYGFSCGRRFSPGSCSRAAWPFSAISSARRDRLPDPRAETMGGNWVRGLPRNRAGRPIS